MSMFDAGRGIGDLCEQLNSGGNVWSAIKEPCKAATTANITLSGRQPIDGVSLPDGARVLVKDQTFPVLNGIYLHNSNGPWPRALDWADEAEVVEGTVVHVQQGTTQAGYDFRVTTSGDITVGVTEVALDVAYSSASSSFIQSGTGAGTRTQQAKSREIMSVTDFEVSSGVLVTGDGTDETVGIQRAATAAAGRMLFWPKPTSKYKVTAAITFADGVRNIGDGWPEVHQGTANTTTFIPGNDNEFAYLEFTGTGAYSAGGRGCIDGDPGGTGTTSARVWIHHCKVDSTISTTAFGGDYCVDWWIEDNILELGAESEHGVYCSTGSTNVWICRNKLKKTGVAAASGCVAVNIKGSTNMHVLDNEITGTGWNGYGVLTSTAVSGNIDITDNRIKDIHADAIPIRVGSSAADTDIVVSKNIIDSGCDNGIYSQAARVSIKNNKVRNTTSVGIYIDGTGVDTSKTVAQANEVYDCVGGIRVVTADAGTYILDNVVVGSSGVGIAYEAGSTTGGVFGNQVSGHATAYNIAVAVPSDVGSPFTPTFTNLTETPGTGAVTKAGKFFQYGNVINWFVRISYTGTATSESTNTSTYMDPPVALTANTFQGEALVLSIQTAGSGSNIGTGSIKLSDGKIYMPAWAADGLELIIKGSYSV